MSLEVRRVRVDDLVQQPLALHEILLRLFAKAPDQTPRPADADRVSDLELAPTLRIGRPEWPAVFRLCLRSRLTRFRWHNRRESRGSTTSRASARPPAPLPSGAGTQG